MPIKLAADFLDYLAEKQRENRLYMRWIVGPQFTVAFDDFKKSLEPVVVREDKEIMNEIEEAYRKAGLI